jgi:N-methylhydantoinase A/oxoprolinase/acetone carboxylase beta subunit
MIAQMIAQLPSLDPVMSPKPPTRVIGIDVGGTNTDSVILQNEKVLAWHKTPTTSDIQKGVELAIKAVIENAKIPSDSVASVKIGTTQFVNAVLEQNSSKLDKVAVIRLCGPYSRGSPPFVDFPSRLKVLMQGHVGYVDGGYQGNFARDCDF